jgi:hypothetical protein
MHACSSKQVLELLAYHHGVDLFYDVRLHAGTRKATNLDRPLSKAGDRADATNIGN